jgi:hypothetical protein
MVAYLLLLFQHDYDMFRVHIFQCICVTIKMSSFQKSINYESTIVVIMTTSLAIGLAWHSSYIHLQVS